VKVNEKNLGKLDKEYAGYLKGDTVEAFLDDFGINFSAGHWCAGDFCDRFAAGGYNSDEPAMQSDILSQIERVAGAGMKGIELQSHLFFDDSFDKDTAAINAVKEALARHSLVPTNMGTTLFDRPKWKFGGITNPDGAVREEAIGVALRTIDIARELGCSSVSLWPGADGWDYNFQVDYSLLLDRFVEGCVRINRKAAETGLRFGIEAKLHEPREGNMVVPTTHFAALVAKAVNEECGGGNMGVAIDYGHEQMYAVEPSFTVYAAVKFGAPVLNIHVNSAKLHSNDEDRIAGTGDNWRFAEFLYATIDTGYEGWFSLDQFTYRMEPVKAMSLSRELFTNVMKKALQIYRVREKLAEAQATGNAGGTIDIVKELLI
jgi:xylose isomerase